MVTQPTDGDAENGVETGAAGRAATALADAVRTTLGPRGMDKMVIGENGTVIVTNDGSSILEWMDVTHPVGRVVERVAGAQDDAVGDGTTTTVVLAAALIDQATALRSEGLRPTTIVDGYAHAAETALDRLEQYEISIDGDHTDRLKAVARTAVTGRWDDASTERFAALTLDALRAVEFDTSKLTLKSYAGGELRESACLDGIVVDLDASSTSLDGPEPTGPRALDGPTVALVDGEVGLSEPAQLQSVQLETTEQRAAFQTHEREHRADTVDRVNQLGVTVLFTQKEIDEAVGTALANNGILAVERTRRDEFDVIARATGSTPATSVDALTPAHTGTVGAVAQHTVGTTETLVLRECPVEQRASLLLRGGTPHVAEEVRRIIDDCIAVVRRSLGDGALLPGGGAVPTRLAMDLSAAAPGVADRRQLVFDGFASALESIPRTLAANAGTNPVDVLTSLKRRHDAGTVTAGVGPDGRPCEMVDAGVLEPATVFKTALRRAVAVATMVLRVDDVVTVGTEDSGHDGHERHKTATGGYPWAVGH